MSRPLEKGLAKGAGWIPLRRYENEWETLDFRFQTSDFRRLKSPSLKRASPHIYLRRFHMIMRRTTPVLPIEPAEPLSRGIGGRIDPSTQSSLVLAEVVAHTSFLPAQDDDTRVPLFADFRASPHILRRSRHHNPNPEPCTRHSIFPLYATIELLQELSHRKKDFL